MIDISSPLAYVLQDAVDADGQPLADPKLARKLVPGYAGGIPDPFGGNIQTTGTLELLFPLPFIEDRSRVRSSIFVDAGNVFSSYCTSDQSQTNNCSGFEFGEMRYSAGISISWLSGAFGIMSFSLAKPVTRSTIDEDETFQFDLGGNF